MNKRLFGMILTIMILWCGVCCAQEGFYSEMPPYLRMEQKMISEEIARSVYIRRTYPKTANEQVDQEIAALVDRMAEENRALLPAKAKDIPAYLDVGAVISRTGTSWMSFLTLAQVSADKAQLNTQFDARVYDMQTGSRVLLTDVFAGDSAAWELLASEVRAQLSAAFPQEEADAQQLDALCTREALESAAFTLGAARLTLTYRADALYPGKNTLLHVHVYYPDIRSMMTARAQLQTDNSRFQMVALTFDDGGARGSTRRVLDVLREHGAQATFFIVGYSIANNRDMLARQQDAGHSIQTHTYSHKYPEDITREQAYRDKARFAKELSAVIGPEPSLMRAPGGQEKFYVRIGIGYPMLNWSLASGDSGNDNVRSIYKKLVRDADDGDVILMHDLNSRCSEYARLTLDALEEKGFLFVTVEELFADAGAPLEKDRVYFKPHKEKTE